MTFDEVMDHISMEITKLRHERAMYDYEINKNEEDISDLTVEFRNEVQSKIDALEELEAMIFVRHFEDERREKHSKTGRRIISETEVKEE